MTFVLLLLGIASGVYTGRSHLGVRHAWEEAKPEILEEYDRIDRQDEYWDCMQSMWGRDHDLGQRARPGRLVEAGRDSPAAKLAGMERTPGLAKEEIRGVPARERIL